MKPDCGLSSTIMNPAPNPSRARGQGAELVRIIRKIAQVERRLAEIDEEVGKLEKSEQFQLKAKVDEAATESRDLLREMAEALDSQIAVSRERPQSLSEYS